VGGGWYAYDLLTGLNGKILPPKGQWKWTVHWKSTNTREFTERTSSAIIIIPRPEGRCLWLEPSAIYSARPTIEQIHTHTHRGDGNVTSFPSATKRRTSDGRGNGNATVYRACIPERQRQRENTRVRDTPIHRVGRSWLFVRTRVITHGKTTWYMTVHPPLPLPV